MSSTTHMIVGMLTVALFLINTGAYAYGFIAGKTVLRHRIISFAAATALLLQYALGFMLIGANHRITFTHWLIALIALIPVALEHTMTANQPNFRTKSLLGMIMSALALVAVLGAYAIAEMR